VEFNPAAERVFGFTREEAVGKELAELIIPPSLRERHRQGLPRYLKTGEGSVLDRIDAVRSDGSEILVELAITSFRIHKHEEVIGKAGNGSSTMKPFASTWRRCRTPPNELGGKISTERTRDQDSGISPVSIDIARKSRINHHASVVPRR
jgi:PAS domain-containing protein